MHTLSTDKGSGEMNDVTKAPTPHLEGKQRDHHFSDLLSAAAGVFNTPVSVNHLLL